MLHGSYSLNYASPQQRSGSDPDPRDDIHALGVIGYQMLTGRLDAAPGTDVAEDLEDLKVSADVIRVVKACAASDANRRPKDGAALVAMLGKPMAVAKRVPVPEPAAEKPVLLTPAPPGGGRRWLVLTAVSLALILVLAVLLLRGKPQSEPFLSEPRGNPLPPRPPAITDTPSPKPGDETTRDFAGTEAAFTALSADERPPGLDCTGENGVGPNTVRAAQKAWAKFLGEKSHEKTMALDKAGKVLIEMVLVPPGKYYRGSPAGKGSDDERPQKVIALTKAMWVGKYEVTQAQYVAATGKANPSMFAKEGADAVKYPVEEVSHDDAVAFCTAATGGNFQLLTEAQWEYACRAGTRTDWYNGDDEKKVGEIAQFDGNNDKATAEVGSKAANAFGLSDMAGNVWEWCADWYDGESYATSSEKDPTGSESGSGRVGRGGSWFSSVGLCRSAYRFWYAPGDRDFSLGFRLAVVPSGQ